MNRVVLALTLALLLAGCDMWSGPPLYASAEGVFPFAPGTYRLSGGKDKPRIVRWDGHHFYLHGKRAKAKDEADLRALTIVPLPADGRRVFILQNKIEKGALYGFIEQRGERYSVNLPSCTATQDIVREAGGTVESSVWENVTEAGRENPVPMTEVVAEASRANCLFSTRASLEKAAQRYVKERQLIETIRIERIGN